jgi:pyridoxal phosphate enzyme (YggS family)
VFGENRVQEAGEKIPLLSSLPIQWHLIGHLQTNKSKLAIDLFDLIHTLDSMKLAVALDRHGTALGKKVKTLVEVNLGGEPGKTGILETDLFVLLQSCAALEHVTVQGLMAIPPFHANPQEIRPYFRRLRELRDRAAHAHPEHHLPHLSMGMSHDFEVAIEEGATIVRIGTAIFGERPPG